VQKTIREEVLGTHDVPIRNEIVLFVNFPKEASRMPQVSFVEILFEWDSGERELIDGGHFPNSLT
jgi:hypothetical protein